jgi:hypothetical protein
MVGISHCQCDRSGRSGSLCRRSKPRRPSLSFATTVGVRGKETDPSELIYFKVYKSKTPVIEQAIETAAMVLGSDKSRGYCLRERASGVVGSRNWCENLCRKSEFLKQGAGTTGSLGSATDDRPPAVLLH